MEFSFIADCIGDMPTPIIVLEGPPGVGKSALLHATEHYARHQGFLCLSIKPSGINDRQSFVDAISEQMEAQLKHSLRDIKHTDRGLFRLLQDLGAIEWQNEPESICRQAVSLAQDFKYRGIFLTIDEVQGWLTDYPNKKAVSPFAKALLLHLNDQHANANLKYPIQLLVAGPHGNVAAAVHIMPRRLADGHNFVIDPISDQAVAQIIQDRLNFVNTEGIPPAAVPPAILQEAQRIAQGHCAHATNLAAALMPIAMAAATEGFSSIPETQIESTIQKLHQYRDNHYRQRLRTLADNENDNVHLVHLFAYLQKRAGGNLTPNQLNDICQQQLPKHDPTETSKLVERRIFDLCRRSILTHIDAVNVSTVEGQDPQPTKYYVSPTPSFSDYLVRITQQTDEEGHTHLQQQAAELLPEPSAPAPIWKPPQAAVITPYETIRPFPKDGRFDEAALQPLLECDPASTRLTPNDFR